MSHKLLEINGSVITDIPSFYAEINRVFMTGETWQLGESLDALNDMLYGGYGALAGAETVTIRWNGMDITRAALGYKATIAFLRTRMKERRMFNGAPIVDQLAALEQGQGKTYFDIVLEVFADHPSIKIEAD